MTDKKQAGQKPARLLAVGVDDSRGRGREAWATWDNGRYQFVEMRDLTPPCVESALLILAQTIRTDIGKGALTEQGASDDS